MRRRPSQAEAEAAVRTLIEWAGDDPDREGLAGTPERVVRAYEEFFAGYHEDPVALLETTFEETTTYDEMIVLRDIRLESHGLRPSGACANAKCEHDNETILQHGDQFLSSSFKSVGDRGVSRRQKKSRGRSSQEGSVPGPAACS